MEQLVGAVPNHRSSVMEHFMQDSRSSGDVSILVEDGLLHLINDDHHFAIAVVTLCATANTRSLLGSEGLVCEKFS